MGIAFSWQQVAMADEPAAAVVAELKTASNGIQFVDTLLGTGSTPTKGSLIRCHYIGTLFDGGKEFDSSYSRGKPLSFKVSNEVRAWVVFLALCWSVHPLYRSMYMYNYNTFQLQAFKS